MRQTKQQDGPPRRGAVDEASQKVDFAESELDRRLRLRREVIQHAEQVKGKYRSAQELNAGLASAPVDRSLLDVDLGKPEDEEEREMPPPTGTIVTSNNTFTFRSDGDVQGQRKVTVPYVQGHFQFHPAKGGPPLQVTGYMPVNSFQTNTDADPFSYEPKGSDQADEGKLPFLPDDDYPTLETLMPISPQEAAQEEEEAQLNKDVEFFERNMVKFGQPQKPSRTVIGVEELGFVSKKQFMEDQEEVDKRTLIMNNITWSPFGLLQAVIFFLITVFYFICRVALTFQVETAEEYILTLFLFGIEILYGSLVLFLAVVRCLNFTDFQFYREDEDRIEAITVLVYAHNVAKDILSESVNSILASAREADRRYQIVLYDYADNEDMVQLWRELHNPYIQCVQQHESKDKIPKLTKPEVINIALDTVYPELTALGTEIVCFLDGDETVDEDFFLDAIRYFNMDPKLCMLQYPISQDGPPASDVFCLQRQREGRILSLGMQAMENQFAFGKDCFVRVDYLLAQLTGVVEFCEGDWGNVLARKLHQLRERCFYVHYSKTRTVHHLNVQDTYLQLAQVAFAKLHMASNDRSGLQYDTLSFTQACLYRFEWVWIIVLAISEPFYIAVPLVMIVTGYFPISTSEWFVFGIGFIAYYSVAALILVLDRKDSKIQVMSLWNQLMSDKFLWFQRLRNVYRAVIWRIPINTVEQNLVKEIEDENDNNPLTTVENNVVQQPQQLLVKTTYRLAWDILMSILIVLLSLGTTTVGLWQLFFDMKSEFKISIAILANNISLVLAILFAMYTFMVHFIPVYSSFTSSQTSRAQVSRASFVIAVVLMVFGGIFMVGVPLWYNRFKPDYESIMDLLLDFFQIQKSGDLKNSPYVVTWRGNSAMNDSFTLANRSIADLQGGYYHGAGAVKFTLPMAYALSIMAVSYTHHMNNFQQNPELERKFFDAVQHGADYLTKTVIDNGDKQLPLLVYQVGDVQSDNNYWGRPEQMTMERPARVARLQEPVSEVYAMVAAALLGSSQVIQNWDIDRAYTYSKIAKEAYDRAWDDEISPGSYQYAVNEEFYQQLALFPADGHWDELMYAASWFARINPQSYDFQRNVAQAKARLTFRPVAPALNNTYWIAQAMFANATRKSKDVEEVTNYIDRWIAGDSGVIAYNPYGIAVFGDGQRSVPTAMDVSLIATMVADMQRTRADRKKYLCWAHTQLLAVLGENDYKMSFVVGNEWEGVKYPLRLAHKAASCPPKINAPCASSPLTASTPYFASSGPNPSVARGAVVNGPNRMGRFFDSRQNFQQNEAFIENGASLLGLIALASGGDLEGFCQRRSAVNDVLKFTA
eukprot:TRINITY_DN31512_c0_g1_i1.p1 TRINITY_DN31512_c0_g1~~TRINITY_DN31512_c0_g1_i1.p1  ORF type:complete len:1332 (-),score=171.28 TRINITY_DN31512_c0_g1_i1:324-4319(-)